MRNNINNNSMESFYEDSNGQYVPATSQAPPNTRNGLKRPATLELNPGKSRKARYNASVTAPPVLTSPDMQVLKLVSPELEKIIINNAALPTPTPSSILYPTKVSWQNEKKNKTHQVKVIKSSDILCIEGYSNFNANLCLLFGTHAVLVCKCVPQHVVVLLWNWAFCIYA